MRAGPVEGDFPLVKDAHEELPRNTEEVRGLLRGHFLGVGGKRHRLAVCEIIDDPHQEPIELIGERDLVKFAAVFAAMIAQAAPKLGNRGLVGFRYSGLFDGEGIGGQPL